MTGIARRQLLLGAAFGAAGLTAGAARLRPGTVLFADPAALVPASFARWSAVTSSGVVLPPEDDLSARLYDDLIVRSYRQSGVPSVALVIAYGTRQDYSFQLHRPEICYPASGYSVLGVEERELGIGGTRVPGNVMRARRGERTDCVMYWTRIGERFPQSSWQQRMVITAGVTRWPLDEGALVRFSTYSTGSEEDVRRLESFAGELLTQMDDAGRRMLLGSRIRSV